MKNLAAPVFAVVLAFSTPSVFAEEACTLIAAATDGHEVYRSGERCGDAFSPASTFKLALALMGFDSGLLASPDAPAVAYDPALNAPVASWRQTVTPTTWLRDSVIWYSQALTQKLGMKRFQSYVDALGYGNGDLSGDPGLNNGLTHVWLGSSLKISPEDQVSFLRRIFLRQAPVSVAAEGKLLATAPWFDGSDGWRVQAKTGSAWPEEMGGRQLGWFVGWMEKAGETFVFARLDVDMPHDGSAGSIVRDGFLVQVGSLMASLRH